MPKREHRSNAEWQDIIERQEQSGLTGVAFCLQEGIYAKTFYRQRKLLRRKGLVAETKPFIQVQPKPVQAMPNRQLNQFPNRLHHRKKYLQKKWKRWKKSPSLISP